MFEIWKTKKWRNARNKEMSAVILLFQVFIKDDNIQKRVNKTGIPATTKLGSFLHTLAACLEIG